MDEYHVGCGLAGIYAGTLNKQGTEWLNKSEVTEEARMAVAQYEKERMERKGYRGETVKCTFENGVVLTIVYSLERTGDNQ
jgi:hypothetical protein